MKRLSLKTVLAILIAVFSAIHFGAADRCTRCIRSENGRIARSPEARREFKRMEPCPSTGASTGACPGYVIDHIVALACGGADDPSNMQWQSMKAAKEKDRWERHCPSIQ